ncbi:MAG: dihydroorotate dehydrogenase [Planctomycetota bacterium]
MLRAQLGPLSLKNPIMSASGTFGSGLEGQPFLDLSRLGALVSKTVTVKPRPGNPPARILETPAGMLNSIGLENRGADFFLQETLPRMKELGPRVIVNIGGESIPEFAELAERFCAAGLDALEVNLSCPNVQEGRLYFATEPRLAEEAMARVKAVADVPVFAKLSPNVTDITEIAKAAERGGADGFTAINTLIGMAVDWRARAPVLGRTIGGLSGPAIRPVALRMVYQLSQVTDLPIIGVGGIATADDVLQFLAAGASAVQVGTANFVDPSCMTHILDQLEELLAAEHLTVSKVFRSLRRPPAPSTEVLGR